MKEILHIEKKLQGKLWKFSAQNFLSSRVMHRHDEIEFNLVKRGRGTYLLGDRRYELESRSLTWLFPSQEHILYGESDDFEMWIAVFRPQLLEQVSTEETTKVLLSHDPPGEFCKKLSEIQFERIDRMMNELISVDDDVDRLNSGLGYLALTAWAAHRETDEMIGGSDLHPAVEAAVRELWTDNAPGLPQLAHSVGLSPSRLSRVFKSQVGVSITDFRNRHRIRQFFKIYRNGNSKSFSQAAEESGFGSYAQFHRVFQEAMGCTPAEYKRRARS